MATSSTLAPILRNGTHGTSPMALAHNHPRDPRYSSPNAVNGNPPPGHQPPPSKPQQYLPPLQPQSDPRSSAYPPAPPDQRGAYCNDRRPPYRQEAYSRDPYYTYCRGQPPPSRPPSPNGLLGYRYIAADVYGYPQSDMAVRLLWHRPLRDNGHQLLAGIVGRKRAAAAAPIATPVANARIAPVRTKNVSFSPHQAQCSLSPCQPSQVVCLRALKYSSPTGNRWHQAQSRHLHRPMLPISILVPLLLLGTTTRLFNHSQNHLRLVAKQKPITVASLQGDDVGGRQKNRLKAMDRVRPSAPRGRSPTGQNGSSGALTFGRQGQQFKGEKTSIMSIGNLLVDSDKTLTGPTNLGLANQADDEISATDEIANDSCRCRIRQRRGKIGITNDNACR
uniref:Uncharacterized protein n=1 Tax=Fusarium oxysporum (strain Fo5176) TaxID=660025 RepID=A0A0D2YD00_FUSOF